MAAKIPLKTFWETIERRLSECSVEDLRAILREMARHVHPSGRQDFLAQLGVGKVSISPASTPWENLLGDIEDLAMEIREAMAAADEWEERYGWQEEYEEDSLGPYADFVESATSLFERATLAFDHGEIVLARQAYLKLFGLLEEEDDYGRGISLADLTDVDAQEVVARYLRAVYETEPPGDRSRTLYEEMSRFSRQIPYSLKLVMLEDLIGISPHPFPDRDAFLSNWIAFLRTQDGPMADAWLREAVRLARGTAGLEELARTEGRERPRAYLDWFTALEAEGKYSQVLTAAREALQVLPQGLPIRAAIADHLCIAAERLNDPQSICEGRWEAFAARPTFSRLLDLWEAFPAGDERTVWMQRAVETIEKMCPHRSPFSYPSLDTLEHAVEPDDALLAHARLLAGDLGAAYRAVAQKQVLGWSSSSNDQGLVVSFLLVLLSGKLPGSLPPNLATLWARSLQATAERYGAAREENLSGRAAQTYAHHIAWGRESGRLTLGAEQEKRYLDLCLKIARRRVEAIVGGQHRGSYDKAAALTVACAEVLRLRGEEQAAEVWIREIRERFPRHSSFQRELRSALREE